MSRLWHDGINGTEKHGRTAAVSPDNDSERWSRPVTGRTDLRQMGARRGRLYAARR
ncbi:hypothetical protein AGR5A_Cc150018 [Agrobacterium genomosp. 5 str. CFBP 6626]|nr:hypothetical protein AGR5A_Cc150018 [Agrobacterium genomosp. 5 str. CFBP 6626]